MSRESLAKKLLPVILSGVMNGLVQRFQIGLIISRLARPPAFFDCTAAFFGIQPPFLRAGGRLGRSPGRGPLACFIDQLDQPLDRVAAVRLLRSASARMEHQEAIVADAFPRQSNQPVADIGRQRGRSAHVEP